MRLDGYLDNATLAVSAEPKLQKLRKATQDVEALFMKDLMSAMRRSIPKEDLGDDFGGDIYQDLFDQALAESTSGRGSFGIGSLLYQKLSAAVLSQEKTQLSLQGRQGSTDNHS